MVSRVIKKTRKYWQFKSVTGKPVNANIRPFSIPGYRLPTFLKKRRYGQSWNQVNENSVCMNFLGHTITVHRHIVIQLRRIERAIRNYEKKHRLKTYCPKVIEVGCWRLVRGGKSLSNHSWRIALDLDPDLNPMGGHTYRLPHYVATAFKANRFRWGGDYRGRVDWMHLEA